MRLKDGEPVLVEETRLGRRERLEGEVGERGPAPEPEGLPQKLRASVAISVPEGLNALGRELLEAEAVQLAGLDEKRVAARARRDAVRSEELPEPRDAHLERVLGRTRRFAAPERLDQLIRRDGLIGVDEQEREQHSLLLASELERPAVVLHLERTQDSEVRRCASSVRRTSLTSAP